MTDQEFRNAIEELGLTQVGKHSVESFLDVGQRTARRWAAGQTPVPRAVELLFLLMLDQGLSVDDVIKMAGKFYDE